MQKGFAKIHFSHTLWHNLLSFRAQTVKKERNPTGFVQTHASGQTT